MQEPKSNKSTGEVSSHKVYGYRLQVKVEGLDQQPTYVHSYALTPDGISIANGTEFIPTGLETKTITVGLCRGQGFLISVNEAPMICILETATIRNITFRNSSAVLPNNLTMTPLFSGSIDAPPETAS
jgi:hypothetical protein